MNRIFLAGLLGGIAMFIWTSIAHMALPLGETGVREIANESIVLDAMQANIGDQSGLSYFPGLGVGPNPTREQKSEAMKKMDKALAHHPSGILIYHPAGSRPFKMASLSSVEFVMELIKAFLAVFLLAQTRLTSYGARVCFVTVIGVIAAIATNVSYWNWCGFPSNYTAAYAACNSVCVGCASRVLVAAKRRVSRAGRGKTPRPALGNECATQKTRRLATLRRFVLFCLPRVGDETEAADDQHDGKRLTAGEGAG